MLHLYFHVISLFSHFSSIIIAVLLPITIIIIILAVLIAKVHQVYSLICRHNLKPDSEVFRRMISLCIKMKDVIFYLNFVFMFTLLLFYVLKCIAFQKLNFHGYQILIFLYAV